MSIRTQVRDSWIKQFSGKLVILGLLFGGVAGCAPLATQPADPTTPIPPVEATQPVDPITPITPTPLVAATAPSGWETYTNQGQCGYAISHPTDMDGTSQATNSWTLTVTSSEPGGPVPNFVYISVIPDDFQGGPGVIYNYDPADTETLLNMQVGESRSFREGNLSDMAPWFTYNRLPDTTLSNQTAQTYENTQPWEFPPGTKEIRYYLQANGCTYLIGGYLATVGSGQTGAISEELFDEIIATFHVNP